METENIDLQESVEIAAYITVSLAVPIALLYFGAERGVIPGTFSVTLSIENAIIGAAIIFSLAFGISVLDQWME